ncbi:ABC transporter permease [Stratiformator vulcanicus]|uniref:Oligopeptide transport system permease protein OppC n=1 Tax=Stratiformator vulcanicus TaxID=2527980 RepID=A0A517R0A1_9PLAN|nr:ABC transporter permease [Stratiformator vulcanicus]QDT37327.1 Oligopeptide transport system permease protein OppC [Stratiformator vulcanicus]
MIVASTGAVHTTADSIRNEIPLGESQSALIWKGFKQRYLAVVSAVVIFLLISISILAPIIANDRPLAYYGINRFQQSESVRNARTILRLLPTKIAADDFPDQEWRGVRLELSSLRSQFSVEDGDKVSQFEASLEAPIDNLREVTTQLPQVADPLADLLEKMDATQLRRLLTGIEPELEKTRLWPDLRIDLGTDNNEAASLNEQRRQGLIKVTRDGEPSFLRAVVDAVKNRSADDSASKIAAVDTSLTAIESELRGINSELSSAARDLRSRFSTRQVEPVNRWHFPVFDSLIYGDIAALIVEFGLVLALIAALLPWFGGRTIRRILSLTVVSAAVVAGVWYLAVPDRVDRSPYKQGVLADAESANAKPIVYQSVVWPLIPYGLDEDNLNKKFGAPPWWPEKDEAEDQVNNQAVQPSDVVVNTWDKPHWLGTDKIGRDVLSRMIWGGRVSLSVGIVAVGIYVAIGIVVGAVAGFFGGWVDMLLSRVIEIVIVFPSFFLILTIVAFIGPSIWNIMVVIGLTGWTGVARLVRGEFLRLSGQEFVLAGRALGYPASRLIFRHILPNALAPVLVAATFGIAGAILTESALSFLGLGITVPRPSWGGILAEGRDYIRIASWLIYFPGFAIFMTITSYNLVGDTLRDVSDPRLRGSR